MSQLAFPLPSQPRGERERDALYAAALYLRASGVPVYRCGIGQSMVGGRIISNADLPRLAEEMVVGK